MRLVTYEDAGGSERLGVLVAGKVVDLASARDACQQETHKDMPALPSDMMTLLNQGDSATKAASKVVDWANGQLEKTGKVGAVSGDVISYNPDNVRLRAPVPRPPKILCLAINYLSHAEEVRALLQGAEAQPPQKPYVFVKPGTGGIVGTGDKVIRPRGSQDFVFEGELAVVIGQRCRFVPRDRAYEVIAGYTAVNDMTARDLGMLNIPGLPGAFDWFQAKAFDTGLPMGPCLTLKDEIIDPHNLRLTVRVNEQTVQDASTADMFHKIPETIEFISGILTLEPGDIICTGTPWGSRKALRAGDRMEIEITDIGVLSNSVVDRED